MKNIILLLFITIAGSISLAAQNVRQKNEQKYDLPELHTIKSATVSPYGCHLEDGKQKSYEESSIFLSDYSKKLRNPDLFLTFGCRSEEAFEPSTAGDSFSLIADLGAEVSLEEVSVSRAFNIRRIHSFSEYSRFSQKVKVIQSHVYAVVINQSDKRGLFVFKVVEYVPNEKVVLQYVVKSYQINGHRSEGFDWEKINSSQ